MTQFGTGEKPKLRRNLTKEAIALAMQGRWEEAVEVNKSIIEFFPADIDACNRLGKALTELGQLGEAMEIYSRATKIDPNNTIARKNLERLSYLKGEQLAPKDSQKLDPELFIEETGKTSLIDLDSPAPPEVLAKMAAGDQVQLRIRGQDLVVENTGGEYLGQIEPRLGSRLIKLIEGGNRYVAAIASLGPATGKVMIREVFQHPSQVGRPSFPSKVVEDFRPYVKDSILKYELEDEEELFEEAGYSIEWEREKAAGPSAKNAPLVDEEVSASQQGDEGKMAED